MSKLVVDAGEMLKSDQHRRAIETAKEMVEYYDNDEGTLLDLVVNKDEYMAMRCEICKAKHSGDDIEDRCLGTVDDRKECLDGLLKYGEGAVLFSEALDQFNTLTTPQQKEGEK